MLSAEVSYKVNDTYVRYLNKYCTIIIKLTKELEDAADQPDT